MGAGLRGPRIVVELSGVDYISSAGIAAIEECAARLQAEGRALVVRGASGATAFCLDIVRVPHE
jgi:anti-anti-sigma regulatory factor